jgi:hypothetical protein
MVIIKNSHQGTKAQRNTKEFILKKFLVPWCAAFWWQIFFSYG